MTQTEAFRQSACEVISIPRRSRAAMVAGMMSPWLQSTVRSGTSANNSSTGSKGSYSQIRGSIVISRLVSSASGSRVCTHRTYGLESNVLGSRVLRRAARACDCVQPVFDSGRSMSSPDHTRRSPAFACRTTKIAISVKAPALQQCLMPAGELTSEHNEQCCGGNACKGRSPNDETLIDCSFRHCRCARA